MAKKRPSPIWGPLLTVTLMLGSVGAVVAIAGFVEARQSAPQPILFTATPGATAWNDLPSPGRQRARSGEQQGRAAGG
jgi:hypothetical protein